LISVHIKQSPTTIQLDELSEHFSMYTFHKKNENTALIISVEHRGPYSVKAHAPNLYCYRSNKNITLITV